MVETRVPAWLVLLSALWFGCTGSIAPSGVSLAGEDQPGGRGGGAGRGGSTVDGGNAGGMGGGAACPPVSRPTRRLSLTEYRRTLRDLFGGQLAVTIDLTPDQTGKSFDNDAASLVATPVLVQDYHVAALTVAAAAVKLPALLEGLTGCPPADAAQESRCGRAFIERFGARAFRRPLVTGEVEELAALFEKNRVQIDFAGALEVTIAAILQQPEVLYRLEGAAPDAETARLWRPYEVASRLSYLLWQSLPDAALLEAARSGRLGTRSGVAGEVRRLLGDERARATLIDFHRQWLDFDRVLHEADKDPTLYPKWSAAARNAAREEADRFAGEVAFDRQGTLADLLESPRTVVNGPLARLYGVTAPASGWSAVTLPAGERAGIFTRIGFLAGTSHARNGSPPLRGTAILEHALCTAFPAPPDDVDLSNPAQSPGAARKTNRQAFEERTASATCQGCHRVIDGVGYGLEVSDAAGGFRTTDNGQPVNARSALVGTDVDGPFDGPVELSRRLATSGQVRACLVETWLRFAHARNLGPQDMCGRDRLRAAFERGGGKFLDLLEATAVEVALAGAPNP